MNAELWSHGAAVYRTLLLAVTSWEAARVTSSCLSATWELGVQKAECCWAAHPGQHPSSALTCFCIALLLVPALRSAGVTILLCLKPAGLQALL